MSAEFMREYDDDIVVAAVGNMERTLRSFTYVAQYLKEIEDRYQEFPGGQEEIANMIYAAQFVTDREEDDYGDEVTAFYSGELLGLEFINYIQPGVEDFFKRGYASSYTRYKLKQDLPSNHKEESREDMLRRTSSLSGIIRDELQAPITAHYLSPIYEEFGQKLSVTLSDDAEEQNLAMMGFRMVVVEALKPIAQNQAAELFSDFPSLGYDDTIERTEEMIGEQAPFDFVSWTDISDIRKTIYRKYLQSTVQAQQLDDTPTDESDTAIEKVMEGYNRTFARFEQGDLLSFQGELFGLISGEASPNVFNKTTEIRGLFSALKIVEAPINTQLPVALANPYSGNKYERHLEATVAVRLTNPVFTYYVGDEPTIELAYDRFVDIPLSYKNVTIKHIDALTLESDQ